MLHGRLGGGTSPATPAIRSGRHRWYGPWTCARTPHPGTASSSCCPGQGQLHPRGSSTFPRPNPARTGSAWARSQTTSTLPPPMPRPSAAVARARPDPASSTIPVASHGRPGRQRVRQQRAAGTRRSAMPATNGRHGARSENQVPRTERWATPSDSRRVLAWLRSHEPILRPGSFAVLRMAVPAPAAWWLRGNARMSDPGLQGQPCPAGGQSPRPVLLLRPANPARTAALGWLGCPVPLPRS